MDRIEANEIVIDGVAYDVEDFQKIHPGGNIISYYKGQDATLVWKEFHYRCPTAAKRLNTLKSRVVGRGREENELIEDFVKLRGELVKEGFFEPSYSHIAYRLVELFVLHYVGFYLLTNGWPLLGITVWSFANGRCGWLMHEAGHGSFTTHPKVDKIIQSIVFGLGNGMSGSYWNNQHNKHHACPQKIGYDIDLNTLPLVAFHSSIAQKTKPTLWLYYQAYLFPLITTTLVTLSWALFFHPRYILRRKNYLELLCYLLRWAFVLHYLTLPLFLLNASIGGFYIFLNFALSHTHHDVIQDKSHFPSWVEFAVNYTTNISGPFWSWWMGYLNYQIEHHLFPSMPQFRHPSVAPRVRALLLKHGLKYDLRSYGEALSVTMTNLDRVGKGN